jgi:hypothetical protein
MVAALPPYGDYLREVISLGKRTIPRTLPALAFLYFYRLGMGLFLNATPTTDASLDDASRSMATILMVSCAYVPLVLCLFAPMLPVQDAIRRGEPSGFWEGIRRVVRVMWKLVASQLVQGLIVLAPIGVLVGAALAATSRFESLPPGVGALVAVTVFLPAALWFFLATFYFMFAMPALVLDLEGPVQSIRTSVRLVRQRFGAVFGRLFVYVLLSFLAALVASAPSSILSAVIAASGNENPMLRIPGIIWESAVEALLFPFGVAAVVVLYRTLAPVRAAESAPAAVFPEEARLTASPFPFE